MDVDKNFFKDFLDIKFNIITKLLEKPYFEDKTFENIFLDFCEKQNRNSNSKFYKISLIILLITNILPFIFLIQEGFLVNICLIDIIFSCLFIILVISFHIFKNNIIYREIIYLLQIFMINTRFYLKELMFYTAFKSNLNTEKNTSNSQLDFLFILRLRYILLFITNILLLFSDKVNHILVSAFFIFYILFNNGICFHFSSTENNKETNGSFNYNSHRCGNIPDKSYANFFIDEILVVFIFFLFFYFRKIWEINKRKFFAEKYKTKILYLYTKDYVSGFNEDQLQLNFHVLKNSFISNNENFLNFVNSNFGNNFNSKKISRNDIFQKFANKHNKEADKSAIKNLSLSDILFRKGINQGENLIPTLLKNFITYESENELEMHEEKEENKGIEQVDEEEKQKASIYNGNFPETSIKEANLLEKIYSFKRNEFFLNSSQEIVNLGLFCFNPHTIQEEINSQNTFSKKNNILFKDIEKEREFVSKSNINYEYNETEKNIFINEKENDNENKNNRSSNINKFSENKNGKNSKYYNNEVKKFSVNVLNCPTNKDVNNSYDCNILSIISNNNSNSSSNIYHLDNINNINLDYENRNKDNLRNKLSFCSNHINYNNDNFNGEQVNKHFINFACPIIQDNDKEHNIFKNFEQYEFLKNENNYQGQKIISEKSDIKASSAKDLVKFNLKTNEHNSKSKFTQFILNNDGNFEGSETCLEPHNTNNRNKNKFFNQNLSISQRENRIHNLKNPHKNIQRNNKEDNSNYSKIFENRINSNLDQISMVNSAYDKKSFFQAYLRRIFISKENVIYNITLNDVSHEISSKLKITTEKKKNLELIFKFSNEFKNYLNSIVCLLEYLKGICPAFLDISFSNSTSHDGIMNSFFRKSNVKKLKEEVSNTIYLLENLSNYLMFLTRDISNWLNISEIDNIKIENNLVNLNQMSSTCFNILKSLLYCNMAKLKKIKPEMKYDPILDTISLDSDQEKINQILVNFISNSVKFTAEGFIRLLFKLKAKKQIIKISIEDSGKGIEEIDQKYLFSKNNCKRKKNNLNDFNNQNIGTGLSLYFCKVIAKKLNFEIKLKSISNKGTKISLIIDLNKIKHSYINNSINNINCNVNNIKISNAGSYYKNIVSSDENKPKKEFLKNLEPIINKVEENKNKKNMKTVNNIKSHRVISFVNNLEIHNFNNPNSTINNSMDVPHGQFIHLSHPKSKLNKNNQTTVKLKNSQTFFNYNDIHHVEILPFPSFRDGNDDSNPDNHYDEDIINVSNESSNIKSTEMYKEIRINKIPSSAFRNLSSSMNLNSLQMNHKINRNLGKTSIDNKMRSWNAGVISLSSRFLTKSADNDYPNFNYIKLDV